MRSLVLRASTERFGASARLAAEKPQTGSNAKDVKGKECYQTSTACWKNYAKLLEAEIDGKKKLKIRAAAQTIRKNPKMRTRWVCKIAGIPKSVYYFNRKNNRKEIKGMKVVPLIGKLPEKMRKRAGSRAKPEKIKQKSGIVVNHKRMARMCSEYHDTVVVALFSSYH